MPSSWANRAMKSIDSFASSMCDAVVHCARTPPPLRPEAPSHR